MTFYAIHTKPRAEATANLNLQEIGCEVLYLHYRDTVRHARKVTEVLKPYFPRYLFARGATLYQINNTIGVATMVYFAGEALPVPGEVMDELRARGDRNGLVDLQPDELEARRRYEKGEIVKINGGPFEGLCGAVGLDRGKSVQVWIELFQGRVQAELLPEQVSPEVRRLIA